MENAVNVLDFTTDIYLHVSRRIRTWTRYKLDFK